VANKINHKNFWRSNKARHRKLDTVANNNERLDAIGNCDEKFRRSGKVGAIVKHDGKIQRDGEVGAVVKHTGKIQRNGELGVIANTIGGLGMKRKFRRNGKTQHDSRKFRRKKADRVKKLFAQKASLQ
jgi:hypothetical protein